MKLLELVNQNGSKEMTIAIVSLYSLIHVKAPSWQILMLGLFAIMVQGILGLQSKKKKEEGKSES